MSYVQPQLDSSPRPMMILASQTDQVSSAGAHVLVQNSSSTLCYEISQPSKELLSLSCWNINGWTNANRVLKSQIIQQFDSDVMCLLETHLKNDEAVCVNNYTWFGYNRKVKDIRATKFSGGVGILVKIHFLVCLKCKCLKNHMRV